MNKIKVYLVSFLSVALCLSSSMPAYAVSVSENITLKTTNGSDITLLSGGSFDSMTVGSNSFTFTLSGSQSLTLRDSDAQVLKTNISNLAGSCEGGNSEIILSASNGASIQVFIEGFGCSSASGGGGSYTSGGGGSSDTTTTQTTAATQTTATTQTTVQTTTATQTTQPSYLEGAPPSPTSVAIPAPVSSVISTVYSGIMSLNKGLGVGSTGDDVTALQEVLRSMPDVYPEGIVSGRYGSLTKAAVGRFQIKYGVVTSSSDAGYGYVGPKTRAKLQEVFGGSVSSQIPVLSTPPSGSILTRELKLGVSGDDVIQLQAFLAADSSLYPEGKITGYYGSLTVTAVRRFQERYGISQVGRVGPQTLAKLNEVMGQNMSIPQVPATTQNDEAAKADLQKQIMDLQALIESLTKQIQSTQ